MKFQPISGDPLIDRTRILDRIKHRGSPLVALLAPAGYAKTDVAHAVAETYGSFIRIECQADTPMAVELATLLGASSPDALGIRQAWNAKNDTALIVDNIECLSIPKDIECVRALLDPQPGNRRILFCARRDPGVGFSAHAAPNTITILRAEHLALDEREMHKLFESTDVDDGLLYRLHSITGGWPIPALYCLRVAQSGDIEELFEGTVENSFDDLMDYIDRNVIVNLPLSVFSGLCAAVGFPSIHPEEIDRLYGVTGEMPLSFAMTRIYQVASSRGTVGIDVNGLVRCAVRARHGREVSDAQCTFGDACKLRHEFGRAAQAYLSAGDISAAESVLESSRGFGARASFDAFTAIPELQSMADLVSHPKLWAAVLGVRRLMVHPSILANEATVVLRSLNDRSDPVTANAVRALSAIAFMDAGMVREAGALVDSLDIPPSGVPQESLLPLLAARATLDSYLGAYDRSLATWHQIRSRAMLNGAVYAQLTRVEIRAARARGHWEIEHEAVERMLRAAQESHADAIVAMALAEGVFGAWLAQEDDLFEAYRTQLALLVREYELPALVNFNLATLGLPLTLKETSKGWDALANLMACANGRDDAFSITLANRAVALADEVSAAFPRVLARVALAEKVSSRRTSLLQEALEIAATMDSPPLQRSLAWLLEHFEPFGMLTPFVHRLRARGVQLEIATEDVTVLVGLGDALVRLNGVPVNIAQGGWGLLATLALAERPVHRDVLCDRLWPTMPTDAAYNALKMCVRRTRMQLGAPEAIVSTQGGYSLASWVEIDIVEMERLRTAIANDTVDDAQFHRIGMYFAAMHSGRPATFATWEWFAAVEHRLEAMSRAFGEFLCGRALVAAQYPAAIQIAEYLVKLDPLDEPARKLLIQALVGSGDRATAAREFRSYAKVLKDELDVGPPETLKALLHT